MNLRVNIGWKSKALNLRQPKLFTSYKEKCSSNFSIRKCYFLNLENPKRLKILHPPITKPNPLPHSWLPPISCKTFSFPHYSHFWKISSPTFKKVGVDYGVTYWNVQTNPASIAAELLSIMLKDEILKASIFYQHKTI